jgi:hypothetical protein
MPRFPAALAVYILICILIIQLPPRWGSTSGTAALIDKHHRLETLESPKILLIGGSNISVGIDSGVMQKALCMPVVNMGLGASLGLRYMLTEIKEEIRAGDLIVISPEYDYFCRTSKRESNAQLNGSRDLLHVVQVFPEAIKWVLLVYFSNFNALLGALEDLFEFINYKVHFYQDVARKVMDSKKFSEVDRLIRPKNTIFTLRKNYDSYGDFIGHLSLPSPGFAGTGLLNYPEFHFNIEAAEVMNDFGSYSRARKAEVVVIPPPIPVPLYLLRKPLFDYIFERWRRLPALEVLGSPERYSFPMEDMFDTPYHLNSKGRAKRTLLLVCDLKTWQKHQNKKSQE